MFAFSLLASPLDQISGDHVGIACEPRRDLQVYCGTRSAVDGPPAPGSMAGWLLLGSVGWLHYRLDGPTAIRLDGSAPALHPHCRLDGWTAAFRTTGSMARLLPSRTAGSMAPAFRTTGSMARRLSIPATGSMARWLVRGSMALLLQSIRTTGSMARLLPYRLDGPTAAQSHYRLDGPIAAFRTTGSMARLLLIPATDSMARWRVFGSMALLLDSIRTTGSMARLLPYRLDGPMASSPHLGLDGPLVFSRPGSM